MKFVRFAHNPIITPDMSERLCEHGRANVNGPSLIAAPDWLPDRLGRYYLYFAHHQGTYIRLAYADELVGPWRIHEPGTLRLDQTPFDSFRGGHIASPDVHVDEANRRIVMYYHGCPNRDPAIKWHQPTCAAESTDGVHFVSRTGDCPEHIMMSEVPLGDDWTQWQPSRPVSVVKPEMPWEGADCEPAPSIGEPIE